ncbi:MAG: hypothetical protein HYV09_40875 [Deltaproteobacteria bacterium]|nr:hypothetical protein [Deltaproteobacteria bacterium]
MELPPALKPWAAELAIFPPEIAVALGGVVRRLAQLVGPMRTERSIAVADGSGFDGLDRRGSYERLLLSEWLLADELPDEFTRRAAVGEHMFLRPARRGPSHARTSIALFDAGPSQLGSPRLVHIALLIVLARRAAAGNATFRWGILQSPERTLRDDVTRASLLSFVSASTVRTIDRGTVASWLESTSDDVWIVGGEDATAGAGAASRVLVRDVLSLHRRAVTLEVRAPHAPPRGATLDLPPEPITARLLRDPFGAGQTAPTRADATDAPTANLLFSDNASKLFARTSDGVLAIPIPNSARAGVGQPKLLRSPDVIAAIGRVHKRPTMLVATSNGRLALRGGRVAPLGLSTSERDPEETAPWPPSERDALRPLLVRGETVGFVDARGLLFEIDASAAAVAAPPTALVARFVKIAIPIRGGGYAFVGRQVEPGRGGEDDAFAPLQVCTVIGDSTTRRELEHGVVSEAFLTMVGMAPPLVALGVPARPYVISGGGACRELSAPIGARVIGVHRMDANGPALLTIDATRRVVSSIALSADVELFRAPGEITSAAVDTTASTIAVLTKESRLVLYSLARHELLHTFEFRSPR